MRYILFFSMTTLMAWSCSTSNKSLKANTSEVNESKENIELVMSIFQRPAYDLDSVDMKPRLDLCKQNSLSETELVSCSEEEMLKFIYSNLKYPSQAREKRIQGRVILGMIISVEGDIRNLFVVNSVDSLLATEAIRVIALMDEKYDFVPATVDGVPVDCTYLIPVLFKFGN